MKDVRLGLVGTGAAASAFAAAVSRTPHATIEAVVGRTSERAARFATKLGVQSSSADMDALLASPRVDAIILAVPHHLHAPLAMAALTAGKHVVVEKPMTLSLKTADELIAKAARRNLVLAPIAQMRFTAAARILRKTIQSGGLGRPLTVYVSLRLRRTAGYYEAAPWRSDPDSAGGGVLIMNAIHDADLLAWAFGPVDAVYAKTSSAASGLAVEDSAVVSLTFQSGALGTLQATNAAHRESKRIIDVQGTHGRIRIRGSLVEKLRLERSTLGPALGSLLETFGVREPPLVAQMRDIVDAIRHGRAPSVTAESARSVLSLVFAAYESDKTGTAVSPDQYRPPRLDQAQ